MARRVAGASNRWQRQPDAAVVMYTLPGCSHCSRAKQLLRARGVAYEELVGVPTPEFRQQIVQLTGRPTVPQILVHGKPIGGYKQLVRLDARGVLLPRVERAEFPLPLIRRRLSLARLARTVLSMLGGASCSPWLYEVQLLDEEGDVVDRQRVASKPDAEELADALTGMAEPRTA